MKNIFEKADKNRIEEALGILYSARCGVEVKVTLIPKKQKEKELAATSSTQKIKL